MGERKTGLDFLRVFATLQVIMFHLYHNNGYGWRKHERFSFFSVLVKTNNFHFMLISGYMAATSKFQLSKTFPMIIATLCFSLLDFFNAAFFFKRYDFTKMGLMKAFFPLAYGAFWYNLPFLVWQFIFSFISPTIQKVSKKYHLTICFIILFIHAFPWVGLYNGAHTCDQYSIYPFLCMAIIASYIRFYYKGINRYILIILYIILFYFNYLVHQKPQYFVTEWTILKLFGQTWIMRLPSLMFSIPSFLIALSFNIQWKYHFIVQYLSESSMPIFMFHYAVNNRNYWEKAVKPCFHDLNTHWIGVGALTFKIYIVGALIEFVRLHIFNTLVFKRYYYQRFCVQFNKNFMSA